MQASPLLVARVGVEVLVVAEEAVLVLLLAMVLLVVLLRQVQCFLPISRLLLTRAAAVLVVLAQVV